MSLSLPACTAERFFRIDHGQEHLHYVTDICTDDLFLLNPEEEATSGQAVITDGDRLNSGDAALLKDTSNSVIAVPTVVRTDAR